MKLIHIRENHFIDFSLNHQNENPDLLARIIFFLPIIFTLIAGYFFFIRTIRAQALYFVFTWAT
jgi:hypothetical protein